MKKSFKKAAMLLTVAIMCMFMTATGPTKAVAEQTFERTIRAVAIPKVMGIAYFDDSYVGFRAGAEEFNIDLIWDGPTTGSAIEQARMAEDYLVQRVDAILMCPNDSTALETTMQRVKDAGVLSINWDSNFDNSITDYCIISVDPASYGEMIFEQAAASIGGKGEYAILCASLEVADHNAWMEAGLAYLAKNYPDMTLVTDPIPTNEDQEQAYTKTLELINTYPDLRGIIGISSVVAPGSAQAIREQGLQDTIQIGGTSLPSQVADYFRDGAVDFSVLWRPADVAYVTMYVTRMAFEGKPILDGTTLAGHGSGEITIHVTDGNIIIPTVPMVFTADNYMNYDF